MPPSSNCQNNISREASSPNPFILNAFMKANHIPTFLLPPFRNFSQTLHILFFLSLIVIKLKALTYVFILLLFCTHPVILHTSFALIDTLFNSFHLSFSLLHCCYMDPSLSKSLWGSVFSNFPTVFPAGQTHLPSTTTLMICFLEVTWHATRRSVPGWFPCPYLMLAGYEASQEFAI